MEEWWWPGMEIWSQLIFNFLGNTFQNVSVFIIWILCRNRKDSMSKSNNMCPAESENFCLKWNDFVKECRKSKFIFISSNQVQRCVDRGSNINSMFPASELASINRPDCVTNPLNRKYGFVQIHNYLWKSTNICRWSSQIFLFLAPFLASDPGCLQQCFAAGPANSLLSGAPPEGL